MYFKQYSVAEGLAQSTVFQVVQDKNDLYWIGTQAGVSRFDGAEFINYSSRDGLAPNGVRAICEDRQGNIWLGHTGGGITRYRHQRFEEVSMLRGAIDSHITSIVEDTAGGVWITTESSGVFQFSEPDRNLSELDARHYSGNEISDRVFRGYVSPSGSLLFVTDPNVKEYHPDSGRFENVVFEGIPWYFSTTSILVDSQGNWWFGKYNGGLYRYEPEEGTTRMFDLVEAGLVSNWVSEIFEDSRGNIWAGTWGGGLVRIDREDRIRLFTAENGFPGLKIWTLAEDQEQNILIGTQDHGMLAYKGDRFVSFFKSDGLIDPQVWSVLEHSSGQYWFGTSEGISIYDPSSGKTLLRDYPKFRGDRILFLEEDRQGRVWVGTEGVFRVDRRGNSLFDPLINNNIEDLVVTAMDLDSDNNLWVGTLEGLVYYEIDQRRVARLSQIDGLAGNEISTVYADSRNRIWVGSTGKGITLIEGDSLRHVDLGPDFTPRCFTEDKQGLIWIGTEGRGVILLDPETGRVLNTFSEDEGLLANLVNQLSCDRFNNVYIGTNKGLNIYLRSEGRIYAFTPSSGFVGIETKPNATEVDSNGDIWFGTVRGVTRFTPSEEGIRTSEPLTHITRFQVNHRDRPLDQGQDFSYKQNSVIFHFRSITLNPDAVRYSIMLEGVDQDWRPPDTQTRVTYPALRHGRYTFLVRAQSSAGVWNSEPVTFAFEIRPPFYLTWYFILAMVLTAGLIIFGYIKIRERALKRENAILEQRVRERTATVVAQKEELAQKNKDITDSIRYAKRIQFAILPESPPFPDTFVLFKPKDIVSGDFYWFTEVNGRQFFSAVDCTGHGVPGAFMSIIGHNSLTKIVREYDILEPGRILTSLNSEVKSTLHKRSDSTDVLDGMDLALCCYIPDENVLEYAGAFNPLYLVRNGEILEVKPDRKSIGRSSVATDVEFTNNRVEVHPGDTVYLFSDGYADQFGGEFMKKFKLRNLKELFLSIQGKPMSEQRRILDQTIEEWRGDLDQLDDILVIGRKF